MFGLLYQSFNGALEFFVFHGEHPPLAAGIVFHLLSCQLGAFFVALGVSLVGFVCACLQVFAICAKEAPLMTPYICFTFVCLSIATVFWVIVIFWGGSNPERRAVIGNVIWLGIRWYFLWVNASYFNIVQDGERGHEPEESHEMREVTVQGSRQRRSAKEQS